MSDSAWTTKGATLSDKSAREEFKISQEEIIEAINEGYLQFRENNLYGNPYLKLLRCEVEVFVKNTYGQNYLEKKKLESELYLTNSRLKKLKSEIVSLSKRKEELQKKIGDLSLQSTTEMTPIH